MNKKERVELHLHTNMSKFDGVNEVVDLIKMAANLGHSTIAITDYNSVQAFPEAYKLGEKLGMKIIYGMECCFSDDINGKGESHCIILVKNQKGIKDLYKLITSSYLKKCNDKPMILKSELIDNRENFLYGSACENGEIYKAFLNNENEGKIKKLAEFYDYLEVQPTGDKEINKKIIELAKNTGKLAVATGDVHYINEEERTIRQILRYNQGYTDTDNDKLLHFRITDEMLNTFNYLDDELKEEIVITNSNKISDMIDNDIIPIPWQLCNFKIDKADEKLKEKVFENAHKVYGNPLPQKVVERLELELEAIFYVGGASLFEVALLLAEKSEKDGQLFGFRGSVGSSLVAYILGITEINPLTAHYICPNCKTLEFVEDNSYDIGIDLPQKKCEKCGYEFKRDGFNIPFENFFSFKKGKVPDIDFNFSNEYRDTVIEYLKEICGKTKVFIGGVVCSVFHYEEAKKIVENYSKDKNISFNEAEKEEITSKIQRAKVETERHPGIVFIIQQSMDIEDFTPLCYDKKSNIFVTHHHYRYIWESLYNSDFDILKHDDLSLLKKLWDLTGISPYSISLCDEKTLDMICNKVDTNGITEFEHDFTKNIIRQCKPSKFFDLVKISALSHGTGVWLENGEKIISSGVCTIKDIIATRDDIMLYLLEKGVEKKTAYKIMETVRKGRVASGREGKWGEYKNEMITHSVPNWFIESCEKIAYLFPKAHCTDYVKNAFRIAYYKAHFPKEFDTAYNEIYKK